MHSVPLSSSEPVINLTINVAPVRLTERLLEPGWGEKKVLKET